MKTLAYAPETPITEELNWRTDIQTANDGSEVRISLRDTPQRTLAQKFVFNNDDDIRECRSIAIGGLDRAFTLPFYHNAARLTASAAIGTNVVAIDASRGEFRVGCGGLLVDRKGRREAVTVTAVAADALTLAAPLVGAWSAGASIAPVWPVSGGDGASYSRNPLAGGSLGITATETGFIEPYLNPFNVANFVTLGALPVIKFGATGSQFEEGVISGTTRFDYGGVVELDPQWLHSQFTYSRTFLVNRVFDRASWQYWTKLFDYMKGSYQPALMPTFREDFDQVATIAVGANTVTFRGSEYAEDYFPHSAFRQIAVFSGAGVHYATVTACAIVGGNSRLTFAPALPAGAGRTVEQLVSLLLKVRIADDKVVCEHGPIQTRVTLNLRTVDD